MIPQGDAYWKPNSDVFVEEEEEEVRRRKLKPLTVEEMGQAFRRDIDWKPTVMTAAEQDAAYAELRKRDQQESRERERRIQEEKMREEERFNTREAEIDDDRDYEAR